MLLQAGATLPEGVIIDKNGQPTTNPKDYKAGGALLSAAGPKGYGLGLMAELIGGALLGTYGNTSCEVYKWGIQN